MSFTPRTIAVYLPAGSSAMIADSLPSLGAWPLFRISRTWSLVMIPPIIVSHQLSFEAIKAPVLVMQLQCRINERIRNAILSELRTNGANNYPLWFGALNDEATNHHVVAGLYKRARTDVALRAM